MHSIPAFRITKYRLAVILVSIGVGVAALTSYAKYRIESAGRSACYSDTAAVPQTTVGLVLGCSPTLSSGISNPFFENRIQAAARLWKSGKCDVLLLSGDNHTRSYDEPTAMKTRLLALGVPESALALDYAGFSTFDSVVRAKEVFGVSQVCIVSQADHAKRAMFIAHRIGIQACGYAAQEVGFHFGIRTQIRESLARVRTLLDVGILNRKPHFLGARIQITPERNNKA